MMGVDQVKFPVPDERAQRVHRRKEEARGLIEGDDLDTRPETLSERSCATEAAHRDVKAFRIKAVTDLDHDVLHAALMEAVHDLKKSNFRSFAGGMSHELLETRFWNSLPQLESKEEVLFWCRRFRIEPDPGRSKGALWILHSPRSKR
jgi:hypothetical protein